MGGLVKRPDSTRCTAYFWPLHGVSIIFWRRQQMIDNDREDLAPSN